MLGGDLQSDIMQGASALVRNALLRLMDRKAESLIAHDTSRYEIQLASKADLSRRSDISVSRTVAADNGMLGRGFHDKGTRTTNQIVYIRQRLAE